MSAAVAELPADRAALIARSDLAGVDLARALSDQADTVLAQLFADVVGDGGGAALVAVGGYGRGQLAPGSDLDVLLLHRRRVEVGDLAEALWYPLWDAGLKLGHAVRTPEQALQLAGEDLETATSLLDARLLAGDADLAERLAADARAQWTRRARRRLDELVAAAQERRNQAGEVAFLLEPDLKDGRGGLRDVHTLGWIELAETRLDQSDRRAVGEAHDVLQAARVEVQRRTGRTSTVLLLEEQDDVARALDDGDADALMARIAAAARMVSLVTDDVFRAVEQRPGRLRRRAAADETVVAGVTRTATSVRIDADPAHDQLLVLHAAVAAAESGLPIERASLRTLGERQPPLPDPWPEGARALFVQLLATGQAAIPVVERLDLFDVWARLLPEWEPNRSRPQRNAYHRFTVDRHLLEAAAEASRLTHRVTRPDLLLVGALLHDIGKGYPGDHSEVGMDLVADIAPRMGFPPDDVAQLVGLVQHHLLLPDVATRRDLDDEETLAWVAAQLPSADFVELLAALTEADSIATGPSAWGTWKADLVATLAERTAHHMRGGDIATLQRREFPDAGHFELMAEGGRHVIGRDDWLTVVTKDELRVFSRVAGVLALSGLPVVRADAYSSEAGSALSAFQVRVDADSPPDWPQCERLVAQALDGRLAIDARIAERARTYARRVPVRARAAATRVLFDNEIASDTTVVEVHTPDRVGVLYRATSVLADFGLDLRLAKVQTLTGEVVDSFYVRTADGGQLDHELRAEVELALGHALSTEGTAR